MVDELQRNGSDEHYEASLYMQQHGAEQSLRDGAELLDFFGVTIDPVQDTDRFVMAIQQMDPRNTAEGQDHLVRFQLEQDQTQWPQEAQGVILSTARAMDMASAQEQDLARRYKAGEITDADIVLLQAEGSLPAAERTVRQVETPLQGPFDMVVALGGARHAPRDRALYAARAIEEGRASGMLVMASSDRKLVGAEAQVAADYTPRASGDPREYHLGIGAVNAVQEQHPGVLITPVRIAQERANTTMVMEGVLDRFSGAKFQRIGAVTTQIYQRFTELDLRTIGRQHGFRTAVAGNPSDLSIVAARTPSTYLSEELRTLRAAALALPSESA